MPHFPLVSQKTIIVTNGCLQIGLLFVVGMAGYEVGQDHPAVKAYMERVRNDLKPHYGEVMTRFNKFIEKYGDKTASKL